MNHQLNIMPTETIVKMSSAELTGEETNHMTKNNNDPSCVFLVHPIEGHVQCLSTLTSHLCGEVYGLQCTKSAPLGSIPELAAFYIKVKLLHVLDGADLRLYFVYIFKK